MIGKKETFQENVNNLTLRAEYRRRMAKCLTISRNYRGSEAEYQSLMHSLGGMEEWLNGAFGLERWQRFPLDAQVAEAWQRKKRRTIGNILLFAAHRLERNIDHALSGKDLETLLVSEVDGVVLPPDFKPLLMGDGNGEFREVRFQERLKSLLLTLEKQGIYTDDVILIRGKTRKDMMRKTSYTILDIPKLGREVLVCDQVGEATFVVLGIVDRKILLSTGKDELQAKFGTLVSKVVFRDPEQWEKEVTDLLLKDVNTEELKKIDVRTQEGLRTEILKLVPTPEEWAGMCKGKKITFKVFGRGLVAIATKFGVEGDPTQNNLYHFDLGRKIYGEGHECLTYVERPDPSPEELRTEILRLAPTPKKWAGMKQKEKLAFRALGVGLSAIATKFGVEGDPVGRHSIHLDLGRRIYGEGHEYLRVFSPRDRAYYSDTENTRRDLEAFAWALGEDKTPTDLSTDNLPSIFAICSNGEISRGTKWLSNAAVALGLVKNSTEVGGKASEMLKILLSTAGYKVAEHSPRDKAYYSDPENTRRDLEAFAWELGEDKTPLDLTTSNLERIRVLCANGEKVKGITWLLNAAVALGLAKNTHEAGGKRAKTLKTLLYTAGYNAPEYLRDWAYYSDPENTRRDLEAFAWELGEDKTPLDLTTSNLDYRIRVLCANGEMVKGKTWLRNAAVALGLAKNSREAGGKSSETLKKLKEVAAEADTQITKD